MKQAGDMMKSRIFALLLWVGLPCMAAAQSNDDLYFVPKKEAKKEAAAPASKTAAVTKQASKTTVYAAPGSTVIVKDAAGKMRDVDEYNRRYTSRDNTFSVQNDTLYIEEKPAGERGEWVNGFEGSQDDYEYAMRIVRFRSPAYAIPISSPLYWDVVYALPSWNWNVYDDGFYAYVFPTYTNPLWWEWRWSWGVAGPRWGWSWGWHSPWCYSGWYSPYWYCGYWGGWYAGYWGGWHHHHHHPYHGWGGWHYSYNNRRGEIGVPRRSGSYAGGRPVSGNSSYRGGATFDRNGRTGGRVVSGSRNSGTSVRNARSRGYTRSSQLREGNNSAYTRPSSTRTNSYRNSNAYNRMNNSGYQNTNRGMNFNRSSSGSSSRYSGGGGYRSGGGAARSVGGGGGARRR